MAAVFVLSLLGLPQAGAQGLFEPFSYSNGNLTTVSGGAWKLWEPGAGNATVSNGAARFDGTTDLIRNFPAVLTAPGQFATFSFTLTIATGSTAKGFEIAFVPASSPFGAANTNYNNSLVLQFDYPDAAPGPLGMSSIDVVEGTGNSVNFVNNIGLMSLGVPHTLSVNLSRGATNTAYSLFLDNTLLRSSTFVLNDARAINSVEIDQAGANAGSFRTAFIDDLRVVPEPATCLILAIGGVAMASFRRRQTYP